MSFIRTVLGDIPASELGVCYAHEHIIIDPGFTTSLWPEFQIDSVENAVAELTRFHVDGGRAMIDSMPCDAGRNVAKLAEVSRRTGVHIVCPTGLHLAKYYDPGHWSNRYDTGQLADLFLAEIEQGVDTNDYSGPLVARSPGRAGLLKIATDQQIDDRTRRVFAAALSVHRRTGCPILTHTEQGTLALEQIEMLRGANLAHVCLSHTDRKPDPAYHRDILKTGVKVEYDSAFRWKQGNPTLDLIVELAPEFPDQILLGMDAARKSYWRAYGGSPGLSYLLKTFRPLLTDRGLPESIIRKIFIENPAATYCFDEDRPWSAAA